MRKAGKYTGVERETFNLFHLQRGGSNADITTNIVTPGLHLRLGLINKISKSLNAVVRLWEHKTV